MRFVRGKRGMAAAGEDSIIQKLQSAAADGMPAGDGLSAERVQTVLECVRTVERIILHVFIAAKDTGKGAKSVFLFATY